MNEDVVLEITNGIGLVRLNRPEAMNTLTYSMLDGLGRAYRECDANDDIKVVVLTGSGKAFCAGADMADGLTFDTPEDQQVSSCPLSFQAWEVRKPVIAAVNGHAVGVGLGIAIQADIRILAEEGKYGFLQNRRGVVADFAVEYVLPKIVGLEKAFELIVRAPTLRGQEAVEWGIASRCVPQENVLEVAMSLAEEMVDHCSPLVMGLHKRLLWQGADMSLQDFVDRETEFLRYSMGRPDAIEGGMAFVERRNPRFESRISKDWPDHLDRKD